MTHEYTLLVGGTVICGAGQPDATAVAWAMSTVLAVGSDEGVHSISRGDSRVLQLDGAFALAADGGILEAGADASLDVYAADPRTGGGDATSAQPLARIRGGRVVAGVLRQAP